MNWLGFRKALFWTHLILGIALTLPLAVLCVTGFLLAYEIQIETWIDHPPIQPNAPSPSTRALTAEELIEAGHRIPGAELESITFFRDPARPVEATMKKTPDPVYLDAYTGTIIPGRPRIARRGFRKIRAWHIALNATGPHRPAYRALMNAANGIALFSVILGIIIWIPQRWRWARLRTIGLLRWGVAGRARDFNWHNSIGIWIAVPLLVIVWTGMAMSYGWARRLTSWSTPPSNTQRLSPGNTSGAKPLGLDALMLRAKRRAERWRAITLFPPHNDSDPVHFAINMNDYVSPGTVAGLALDRAGGLIYYTPAGAGGISPSTFIRYGHTGEAWGIAGQTVAAVSSFGGAVLIWTGVSLSLRRWKSWQALRSGATLAGARRTS